MREMVAHRWARGQALAAALSAQLAVDPDEIFQLHAKTCPLSEVFAEPGVQVGSTPRLHCASCSVHHTLLSELCSGTPVYPGGGRRGAG